MATKKFIIEVEEGITECKNCPFNEAPDCNGTNWIERFIGCTRYDFATMKIKEPISYEELLEFANQYSHNIWEQLMQRFKADDKFCIGANDVSDYAFNAILDAFKKIMEEEK